MSLDQGARIEAESARFSYETTPPTIQSNMHLSRDASHPPSCRLTYSCLSVPRILSNRIFNSGEETEDRKIDTEAVSLQRSEITETADDAETVALAQPQPQTYLGRARQ